MQPVLDAARLARSLTVVTSGAEIWRQLKAFAMPYGFHHLVVLKRGDALPGRLEGSILHSDAPAFTDAFDRADVGQDDPVLARAMVDPEPFSLAAVHASELSDKQRHVFDWAMKSLAIADGWVFPIVYDGGLKGLVVLGGQQPDMSPLMGSILHLLAHSAFRRVEDLTISGIAPKIHPLSAREAECLRWVALGKTDSEIAIILSISARTARFHIENAKRKLHVATRVQAVAEALRLHAIAA